MTNKAVKDKNDKLSPQEDILPTWGITSPRLLKHGHRYRKLYTYKLSNDSFSELVLLTFL